MNSLNEVATMSRFNPIFATAVALFLVGDPSATEGIEAAEKEITITLPGGVPMEFVWIEPGTFTMGSPEEEPGRLAAEGPQHQVTLTRGFYLGKFEITQAQWQSVMRTAGTEKWRARFVRINPDHPAVYISWQDMQKFIKALNLLHWLSKPQQDPLYRLPTEAEWEYAARAGTTTPWSFGDDETQLGDHAWHEANAWSADRKYAQPAGTRQPNPWGLHDMYGNVWEWVQDWYGGAYYGSSPSSDPLGPSTGDTRVLRGGGFSDVAKGLRSACRFRHIPSARGYSMGARLLRMR